MKHIILSAGVLLQMSSFVQAAEVRLYDPVISVQVISLSDYPIDAPATKKTAVAFVIEFSASYDFREWAHDLGFEGCRRFRGQNSQLPQSAPSKIWPI